MKPLSGREASLLALLAQSQSLTSSDKRRILSALDGDALEIAQAILGQARRPRGAVRDAAKGFKDWADGLAAARPSGSPPGSSSGC